MKCIIWLGNPGTQYHHTRHNIGYMLVDFLREMYRFPEWADSRHHGVVSEGNISGEKIILLKPTTYMNLSGQSVASLVQYYKLDPTRDILVLSDDLDMEFAKVRYREKGSHGGQNGLRDIIEKLGTDTYSRVKIGIGRDPRYAVSDWVLSKLQKSEIETVEQEVLPKVQEYITQWL